MKQLHIFFIAILSVVLILTGCNFFETRTADEPTENGTPFIPPNTPDIVITNFINSVQSKNVENYKQCFTASDFSFVPSAECNAQFPSFFDDWDIDNEQFFMLSLDTRLGSDNNLVLTFKTSTFETMGSDSVVLKTDYTLEYDPVPSVQYPTQYEGIARFTIVPITGGMWAIKRWQDFSLSNSTKETISYLKVHFM